MSVLQKNQIFLNQSPKCEPQLGKRGLYRTVGGQTQEVSNELALLWVLNLSDGTQSLLDIAERSGLRFDMVEQAAGILVHHGLLEEVSP
jgi:aminopeptidase-like protein